MSAPGTTSGPWQASLDDVPYSEFDGVAWQVNSDEGSICTIDSQAVIAEANAHLIAASPTMAAYIQRKADEGDAEAAAIMEMIHARS